MRQQSATLNRQLTDSHAAYTEAKQIAEESKAKCKQTKLELNTLKGTSEKIFDQNKALREKVATLEKEVERWKLLAKPPNDPQALAQNQQPPAPA